jgi:GT2 family glycosyltransferase
MKIWVSVVHWGKAEDTWAALDSVASSSRRPNGIVVIDNAADEPMDPDRALQAGVLLHRENANLGFAAGQNRGMALALQRGADAVLLLNNDAALERDTLEKLLAVLPSHPEIGILGTCVRGAAPPHRIESAGISLNLRTGRMRLRHHGRPSLPPGPELEEVDAVSGAALVATGLLIRRVGYLRPEYFCYYEEVDWCLRARAAGLRVAVLRGARVRHRVAKKGHDHSLTALTTYYGTRNHLRCLSRNAPLGPIGEAIRTGIVASLCGLHALRGPKRKVRLRAVREGLRDARRRVFGPRPDHPGARPAPPPGPNSNAPRVAVVVLAWNRLEETIECLASVAACGRPNTEIILVDNASKEPVGNRVREEFPDVHVIENERNLGYAGGNNVGLRYALSLDVDYVLVLNNDAIVAPDAIDEMVALAEADPEVGAVGARVMQYENRERVYGVVGKLVYMPTLIRLEGLHADNLDRFSATRDGDFIPGCSILIRRRVLRHVGFFDERFFAYHEDVDWCTRAWVAGWRISYLPSAIVYHRGAIHYGASPVADYRYYFYGRNSVLYARKHARPWQMAKLLVTAAIFLVGSIARRMGNGERPGLVFRTAGLIVRGMIDGWRGMGPPLEEIGLR